MAILIDVTIIGSNYYVSGWLHRFSQSALNIIWKPSIVSIIVWALIATLAALKKPACVLIGVIYFPFNLSLIYTNLFFGYKTLFSTDAINILANILAALMLVFFVYVYFVAVTILFKGD